LQRKIATETYNHRKMKQYLLRMTLLLLFPALAAPQPLDETEGEKAEESDVDRSFDEILKIFSRGDKF